MELVCWVLVRKIETLKAKIASYEIENAKVMKQQMILLSSKFDFLLVAKFQSYRYLKRHDLIFFESCLYIFGEQIELDEFGYLL